MQEVLKLVNKRMQKRFVVDRGQLTFYSHQDQSKWNELIMDTLNGVSLKETAVKININERNFFNMRHKLLVSLGTKIDGVKPKLRGTPATKRGLSNQ